MLTSVSLTPEKLLYGFLVPILKDMLESRLGLSPSYTQTVTTAMLTTHGLCSLFSAPVIAHLADKFPDRKHLLLTSLVGCIVGTLMIAYTPSGMNQSKPNPSTASLKSDSNKPTVSALFLGRIIQALAGSATWIASFAMLVDTVEPERKGQTLALAMSVITCGTVTGPAIAGTMFQLAGYWAAWSIPLALLGLDALARLAMVESSSAPATPPRTKSENPTETPSAEPQESDGLLRTPANSYETLEQNPPTPGGKRYGTTTLRSVSNSSFRDPWSDEVEVEVEVEAEVVTIIPKPPGFYRTTLLNPAILAGLANTLGQTIIVAGFDTTLPLFLRNTFGWGSMPIGLIFLGLQGPIILLGPVVGGVRDRMGCRIPTVVGWSIVAPFLLLLALVGRPEFAWAVRGGVWGEVVVVGCIAGVAVGFLLIRGGGGFQVIGMVFFSDFSLFLPWMTDPIFLLTLDLAVARELEDKNPGVFGPHGANAKVIALLEMAFNVGMLLGPLVSGGLLETLGYFWMNCFMCESFRSKIV